MGPKLGSLDEFPLGLSKVSSFDDLNGILFVDLYSYSLKSSVGTSIGLLVGGPAHFKVDFGK